MPDPSAVGIPDRRNLGDLSRVRPGDLLTWLVQEHAAQRAGRHYDVRLGSPELGLYSWATRKGIPAPGGRPHAFYRQPLHEYGYKDFEGELRGYGAGVVRKVEEGSILITKATPTEIHFVRADRREPERFVLLKPPRSKRDTDWLLINVTPRQALPYDKLHFTKLPAAQVEDALRNMREGTSVQTKVDGASSLIRLLRKGVEVSSYRVSATGKPIVHTERLFGGVAPELDIPKKFVGSVLRGELYGVRREGEGEKAIPPQELGGLLNSTIARSLEEQRRKGVQLRDALFDIQQLGKRPVDLRSVPYAKRRAWLEEIARHLPADRFHLMEQATTPEEALRLWQRIRSGEHPLTREGIVIHPPRGKPTKAKLLDERDVYITGFFPGEGRLSGKGAGGFTYALEPGGPTVGRVGTGLSDDLRADMLAHPQDYLGRVARVRHQGSFPQSGALRAPALIALHEDYPMTPLPSQLGKAAAELTSAGRRRISQKNFAIPSRAENKDEKAESGNYPIHDIAHARNALARVSAHGTAEEKAQVRQRVYSKFPSLRPDSHEEGDKQAAFRKVALEATRAAIPSVLTSTVGLANPLALWNAWISPKALDPRIRPSKLKETAETIIGDDEQTRDLLKETLIRQGGADLIDDLLWKKERDEELPWTQQIGGRIWQNPRTTVLNKLLSTLSYGPMMLFRNLMRHSDYIPSSDVVQIYGNAPGELANLLGRAAAHKSRGKIVNDLLAAANYIPLLNVIPQGMALSRAEKMLAKNENLPEELAAEIHPQLMAASLGRIAGPPLSWFHPALALAAQPLGRAYGVLSNSPPKKDRNKTEDNGQ